ncbi:TIGR02117 family protein [Stappia sp. BW2]|uniref:TIGR02117 family protein n=1 Tax=Stappia sp. BW2 TaxID=2592622 RepID=UPI0011DEAD21|nr:TIGR02117 family protein [Stappia sp. BW2]TYC65888.1 TIGR02117 family protein [Stappia sp. BW2]
MMKLLRRTLTGLFLVVCTIILALGLGTLVPRPLFDSAPDTGAALQPSDGRRILVLSNPIHTDIALPADPDVLEAFDFISDAGLDLDYPGVFWVAFGWGGRSFYIETPTWADLKPGPVIDALTWDTSVMHVRRTGDIPSDLDSVRELYLSQQQFDELVADIKASFQANDTETPPAIPGGAYDAHDIFFPAVGGFNALMGCNTWTADILRRAGVKTGVWTPLPVTLDWSLDLHNRL